MEPVTKETGQMSKQEFEKLFYNDHKKSWLELRSNIENIISFLKKEYGPELVNANTLIRQLQLISTLIRVNIKE